MTRFRGGYPALNWLIKRDKKAAYAVWCQIRESGAQVHGEWRGYVDPRGADPDDAEIHEIVDEVMTLEFLREASSDGPDEVAIERLHEDKPALHIMLAAAGGLAGPWCGTRIRRNGRVRWRGEPWLYRFDCSPMIEGHVERLGGLLYYTKPECRREADGGMLVAFIDRQGKLQRPALKTDKPRGGKRRLRSDPAIYLSLGGATPLPATDGLRTPISAQPVLGNFYHPLTRRTPNVLDRVGRYGVEECRAELARLMPSAPPVRRIVPANDGAPLDFAGRLERYLAGENIQIVVRPQFAGAVPDGAQFMGGMVKPKPTSSSGWIGVGDEPVPEAARGDAEIVIEEVRARGTLASIGRALGYRGGYADRAGGKALLAAGRALVAANDNRPQRAAQAA